MHAGFLKQEPCIFKLTTTRKTCGDFVREAHKKLSAAHGNCPSLLHSDELLGRLCHSYSLPRSKPALMPEPSSQSSNEGLLRHRIKQLEYLFGIPLDCQFMPSFDVCRCAQLEHDKACIHAHAGEI